MKITANNKGLVFKSGGWLLEIKACMFGRDKFFLSLEQFVTIREAFIHINILVFFARVIYFVWVLLTFSPTFVSLNGTVTVTPLKRCCIVLMYAFTLVNVFSFVF